MLSIMDVWYPWGELIAYGEERIHDLIVPVTKEAMANAKDTAVFCTACRQLHDLKQKIGKEIHDCYGLDEMEATR